MVLVRMMEHKKLESKLTYTTQDRGYFHSESRINIESTNEKEIITKMIVEILEGIRNYQMNGSVGISGKSLN